jgi:metal-dependent amidase/aminoacylase/carboxypeptidase family protein
MAPHDAMGLIADEAKSWRRQLHQYPELLFELPKTLALVAERLKEFGCDEVVTGFAKSGVSRRSRVSSVGIVKLTS